MKSSTIRYNSDGSIELIEVDVPDPGDYEIQVEGGCCGICSWDIATARYGEKMHPMAPAGHEGVGRVVKVGSKVTEFEEGDRVAGGGFSTVRNVPVIKAPKIRMNKAYKIPDSPLPDEYWIVEPVSCVVTGLDHCRLKAGDRVALIGCGFMGQMLLQGLLHSYAEQVVAIDVVQSRLDLATSLGAEETYNSAEIGAEELTNMLKERDFDVVVDTTGHQGALTMATDIVKSGGIINIFGWLKGDTATFDPSLWHLGGFSVVNSSPSSKIRDPFPPAIRLIDKGIIQLEPLITHVVPLEEYPALMQNILAGDPSYVKGVVRL